MNLELTLEQQFELKKYAGEVPKLSRSDLEEVVTSLLEQNMKLKNCLRGKLSHELGHG